MNLLRCVDPVAVEDIQRIVAQLKNKTLVFLLRICVQEADGYY
jgi:ABC-type lipopolysaccharide export system ATPase subunit